MSEIKQGFRCPICESNYVVTQKRPNGDSHCKECGHTGPTENFHVGSNKKDGAVVKTEEMMIEIANKVVEVFSDRAFLVMAFENDESKQANFISNCKRSDSIIALRTLADRLEKKEQLEMHKGQVH